MELVKNFSDGRQLAVEQDVEGGCKVEIDFVKGGCKVVIFVTADNEKRLWKEDVKRSYM
jgi:hypothetical protein